MTHTPGRHESHDAPSPDATLRDVVDDVEKRGSTGRIPEQQGCGPQVTDYPGLGDAPAGEDAQSTGSDA